MSSQLARRIIDGDGHYSSDFPHEVTNESCKHDIAELMESGEITQADREAILYRNAERFYGLSL